MAVNYALALWWMCATVLANTHCQGCRPLQYQASPSIGFDFTMSYATAAVKFRNGTTIDIVKIDGPPSYWNVMKQLAEDVQREQRGQDPVIPRFRMRRDSAANVYDPGWSREDLTPAQKAIKAAMKPLSQFLGSPGSSEDKQLPSPDEWTKPLIAMVSALTSEVFKAVPEAEKFALFSGPDSLRVHDYLFPRLRLALQSSGIQEWGEFNAASSRAAASYLKFGQFPADHKFSYGKNIFRALIITHTETAMTLADIQTRDGNLYDIAKTANFVKPPMKHTKQQFTQNVRSAIQQFLKIEKAGKEYMDADYDEIILLGSLAERPEFIDGVTVAFGEKIKDPSGKSKIRSISADDQLYAAARGAANFAREGLETSFNGCIPNEWCPRPEPSGTDTVVEEIEIEVNEGYTHAEL